MIKYIKNVSGAAPMEIVIDFIKNNFITQKVLKANDQGNTEIVADANGYPYVRKTILGINLPYNHLIKLNHENIVKTLYAAQDSHYTYVIEEYISGITLKDCLEQNNSFSDDDIRNIALQLCDGLNFLHHNKIIHRDLTPSNIILLHGGMRVKIIDFGAAREISSKAVDTRVLGTPGYAPPEQYGFSSTDQRSDIYSLGKTMLKLIGEIRTSPLRAIFEKCVELDPKRRYKTVSELQKALLNNSSKKNILHLAIAFLLLCNTLCLSYLFYERLKTPSLPPAVNTEGKINIENNDSIVKKQDIATSNYNTKATELKEEPPKQQNTSSAESVTPKAEQNLGETTPQVNQTTNKDSEDQDAPRTYTDSKGIMRTKDGYIIQYPAAFKQVNMQIELDKDSYAPLSGIKGFYSIKPKEYNRPIIRLRNDSEYNIKNPSVRIHSFNLGVDINDISFKNSYGHIEELHTLQVNQKANVSFVYDIKIMGVIPRNSDYDIQILSTIPKFYGMETFYNNNNKVSVSIASNKRPVEFFSYKIVYD